MRALAIVLSVLFFHLTVQGREYSEYSWNPSCDYFDSVNITSGRQLANASYIFDGIVYPLKYIGVYDYEFINGTHKKSAKPHLRGCICKMQNCVRICCPDGEAFNDETWKCYKPNRNVSSIVTVTDGNNNYKDVELKSLFGFVYGRPCAKGYFLDPDYYDDDKWDLHQNGTINRLYDGVKLSKNEYCLSPTPADNQTTMRFNPFNCSVEPQSNLRFLIYGIAVLLSVPFMILTFIIYAAIPELRNLHGKSLCCYLVSLSTGYTCLGYMLLSGGLESGGVQCKIFGSLSYYAFMAGFLWLNIISFDLWWNFRAVSVRENRTQWKRFAMYSTYSWGLALVFLIMVLIFQNSDMPEEMKPGIGGGDNCFLNLHTWMQFIYFYGQLIVTITFNTIVFVLTLYQIHKVNKEMSTMMAKGDSKKSYNKEKAKILLFLRLFIIMGITWSLEFASWLVGQKYEFLFYITDICNAIQGLLIFILFVWRQRVKKLLVNKYYSLRGIRRKDSTTVTQTTKSSGIQMGSTNFSARGSQDEYRKAEAPLMPTISDSEDRDYNLEPKLIKYKTEDSSF